MHAPCDPCQCEFSFVDNTSVLIRGGIASPLPNSPPIHAEWKTRPIRIHGELQVHFMVLSLGLFVISGEVRGLE